MKDSLIYIVEQLLKNNNIFFDKKELEFQIKSHPSYPSLHAITDVLDHFNIVSIAAQVTSDLKTLLELPNCFLAQIETNKGKELVTVVRKKSDYFIFHPSKEKKKNTDLGFLEKFTGIIVAVEKDELLESQDTKNNFGKILFILSFILFVSLLATSIVSISFLLYFVLSAIGVFISNSIIQQEQGNQTALGNAFCSDATEKKDCDAVISSKGALIFNRFKLSNISFVYFIGLTLVSLLLFLQRSDLNTLYVASLLTLPVTIYSIYYQAIAIKKWCLLCLGIVGILWAQVAIVLINFKTATLSFSIKSILITSFGFLVSAAIWKYISPKIKSLKELSQTKIDYFKFKRNFSLFNTLLEKSKQIDTTIHETTGIIFGNTNASLNITVITNPFCGHCKGVHTLVEDILKKYSNEVAIIIRFNVNTNNLESNGVKVTSRLLEVYNFDQLSCLDAMHDIYSGMTTEKWLNKWGFCSDDELYVSVLNNESEWCKINGINFTPEILINGKSFPKEYDRSDLIYFIEELSEYCLENMIANTLKLKKQF